MTSCRISDALIVIMTSCRISEISMKECSAFGVVDHAEWWQVDRGQFHKEIDQGGGKWEEVQYYIMKFCSDCSRHMSLVANFCRNTFFSHFWCEYFSYIIMHWKKTCSHDKIQLVFSVRDVWVTEEVSPQGVTALATCDLTTVVEADTNGEHQLKRAEWAKLLVSVNT